MSDKANDNLKTEGTSSNASQVESEAAGTDAVTTTAATAATAATTNTDGEQQPENHLSADDLDKVRESPSLSSTRLFILMHLISQPQISRTRFLTITITSTLHHYFKILHLRPRFTNHHILGKGNI